MDVTITVLALTTGFLAGALFAFLGVPIPAPPTVAGVAGIVGIFLGFRAIQWLDVGYDLLGALGV